MPEDYASQFMLQEYTRIIDAYHDLHRQKDALIKFYLAFVSLPLSVVAIFLALSRFFQTIPQVGGAAPAQTGNILQALQTAGVFLSILLVFVGVAVLMVMLMIRGEQYLYIKTINGARKYFRDKNGIDAQQYLVLPSETNQLTFGQEELSGRAFWEAMIVGFTNCMLLGFLFYELSIHFGRHGYTALGIATSVFCVSALGFVLFIRNWLKGRLLWQGLSDVATMQRSVAQSTDTAPSTRTRNG